MHLPSAHADAFFRQPLQGLRVDAVLHDVDALHEAFLIFSGIDGHGGLDDDPVKFSTGTYHGEELSLTAMPAALAVSFNDGGQVYTCTAYPTEVTP